MGQIDIDLQRIFEIRDMIADLHPCLERVHPIAIAYRNELAVYDAEPISDKFHFVSRIPVTFTLPEKICAAFPIEGYQNKIACVVTSDVFSSYAGYATVFHEFVHCYQFEEYELNLRRTLGIAREAHARSDYDWELKYSFPYSDSKFSSTYSVLLKALEGNDRTEVDRCRTTLKEELDIGNFEYMVWQEWKEGFARYIENRVRHRLGFPLNEGGGSLPFSRTVFYVGGARLTEFITSAEPDATSDLKTLFHKFKQDS